MMVKSIFKRAKKFFYLKLDFLGSSPELKLKKQKL